jgi:hypothetical protein
MQLAKPVERYLERDCLITQSLLYRDSACFHLCNCARDYAECSNNCLRRNPLRLHKELLYLVRRDWVPHGRCVVRHWQHRTPPQMLDQAEAGLRRSVSPGRVTSEDRSGWIAQLCRVPQGADFV